MKVLTLSQIPEVNNKYSFAMVNGLINNGVDAVICGISTDDLSHYSGPYVGIFDPYSNLKPVRKVISYYKSMKKVLDYCIKNNVEILHIQWCIFSPLDYYFHRKARKKGIKVVITIHDLLPFNTRFYDLYFHKKIYKETDAIIPMSIQNKTDLIDKFHIDLDKIYYIPHGHNMEYAEFIDKIDARKHLNIKSDKKVILFFGQIKKVKGLDVLIKALPYITKRHKDVLCLIAGKEWKDNFSVYQTLIKDLGMDEYVLSDIRFIPDDDMKYYFCAADMVALPYRKIYQSGVVLLAAAYKKPIVATTEGEFPYVIKDKETGLLVKSEDEAALAEAINWYLDNPDKADEFGKACYEDLNVRLSWDKISKEIVNVYKKVI